MISNKLLCGIIILVGMQVQSAPPVGIEWSEKFTLPQQEDGRPSIGVGTPFYGEHKGVAFLAGGSNFPDEPLLKGGKKRYYSDIYALTSGSTNWLHAGQLSQTVAAGMSATTPSGVVCVGGSVDGEITSRVFLLSWDAAKKCAIETSLPDFPGPVQLGGAAVRGNRVYVAGGAGSEALSSDVWMLDLDAQEAGWLPLPPLPGLKARALAQVFVQNGDQKLTFLYVIGGYTKHADGGVQSLTDGYAFDLSQSLESGSWRAISPAVPKGSDMPAWPLIGAKCVEVGDQHVLFFGGLDTDYFDDNQRKMAVLTGAAQEAQRIAYQSTLPTTWNRHVLVYHTVTDRWFVLGEVPFPPTVAGSVIKRSDGTLLLASGEIQPGIRTPLCIAGKFVTKKKFHPLNWAVMGVYFCGLAGMGWWFMRKKKSADDYFKGGGHIPWWAAGISIFAAMFSSISFLAVPALAYMSDWRYAPKVLCVALIPPLVIGCYLPFFRKLNLTSAYEYLEMRFNLACRLFASLAFNLFMVARVAVVAYLPALAVSAATGVDVNLCIVGVSLMTILYCTFGGIEAVIWSDVVQCAVLSGGAVLIFILLVMGTDGGMTGMIHMAGDAQKLKVIDFALDFSEPVIWVVLIGGIAEVFITYTSDQCVIQRYMTTKDIQAAGRSLWLNIPLCAFTGFIFFSIGTALYTYYRSNPECLPVTMPKSDSILPMYMANDMPIGMAGLVMAGLFAATISTLAANLNSSATAITTDWFVRLRKKSSDDRIRVLFAQGCTIMVGLAGMAGALILANMDIRAVYDEFLKFIGILTSGLACLFMLGIFVRRVGSTAALIGLATNYVVCIGLDRMTLAWKPHLLLYGAIGIVTCVVTALAVSFVFPNRKTGIDGLIWKGERKG
ncbi:MAG: sodium/solute symporter [Kiritimatiellae bacterium]|jgi:SSS family solute:Na+ symporter|nr:sodium/solute symporter [Kiritimatiellia bacterium]